MTFDTSNLTPRERAVAALAAAGHTNAEIARRLGITPYTVKNHLRRIYQKTGVANRQGNPRVLLAVHWVQEAQ